MRIPPLYVWCVSVDVGWDVPPGAGEKAPAREGEGRSEGLAGVAGVDDVGCVRDEPYDVVISVLGVFGPHGFVVAVSVGGVYTEGSVAGDGVISQEARFFNMELQDLQCCAATRPGTGTRPFLCPVPAR